MGRHVFISYSHQNTVLMLKVKQILEDAGIPVWTDQDLEVGTDRWQSEVEMQIESCASLLCLLTPESKSSIWVERELSMAQIHQKRQFGVLAKGDERSAVPLSFAASQYVDIRDPQSFASRMNSLVSSIIAHLIDSKDLSDILPEPFGWCNVSTGTTVIRDENTKISNTYEVEQFWIAKYPTTIAQYQTFIDAGDGYFDPRWWEWPKVIQELRSPFRPQLSPLRMQYIGDKRPRIDIEFREAIAYCRWLSYRLGFEVNLPTEKQWQRAAQGDDGRRFPWGSGLPNEDLCNFRSASTTNVDQYPSGKSPFEVFDMSGNAREWCFTDEDGNDLDNADLTRNIVMKGGNWMENRAAPSSYLSTIYRFTQPLYIWSDDLGFRVSTKSNPWKS